MVANKVMDNTAKRSTDDVRAIIDDVQLPTYHKRKHRQELVLLEEHRRQK